MAKGIFNLHDQDTTPGANATFAPPEGWQGDERQYIELMRIRFGTDIGYSQQMTLVADRLNRKALMMGEVTFSGPFATQAKKIAEKISARNKLSAGYQ